MEYFDAKFWVQLVVYVATFSYMWGNVKTRLDVLEKKMDKHNQMQDRLAVVESSLSSVHHRVNELREDIRKRD